MQADEPFSTDRNNSPTWIKCALRYWHYFFSKKCFSSSSVPSNGTETCDVTSVMSLNQECQRFEPFLKRPVARSG